MAELIASIDFQRLLKNRRLSYCDDEDERLVSKETLFEEWFDNLLDRTENYEELVKQKNILRNLFMKKF
jgi:hypothetical protein